MSTCLDVVILTRQADGTPSVKEVDHVIRHSPDGFEWGYSGSGPADLSLSILTKYFDNQIAELYYQDFKRDIIAAIPKQVTNFTIEKTLVSDWINKKKMEREKQFQKKQKNKFNPVLKGMPTFTKCPICNKKFIQKEIPASKVVKCGKCKSLFRV